MFKSALIKLTLYYVVIAMAFSLLFSVVIYHFATVELREGLRHQYSEIIASDHDTDDRNGLTNQEFSRRAAQLYLDLVYFNLVVLVVSATGSYFLARRTLRPIEAAHQAQVRFSAQASHELRTPLAAIRADTESVLMLPRPDKALLIKTLKANLLDIKRIEILANHLLDTARFQSGDRIQKTSVDLKPLVERMVAQAKRTKIGKTAKIKVEAQSVRVYANQESLLLAISALLDNAVKYSAPKPIIMVTLNRDGKMGVLSIVDNGLGIDGEDLKHIYEPFYRSKNTSNPQGYGLGLALTKEIIDSHSGTISIDSSKGHGTKVTIKLPISEA